MTELRENPDLFAILERARLVSSIRPRSLAVRTPQTASSPLLDRGIRKAAVVMLNLTGDPSIDELQFARIFSTQLQRIAGLHVSPAPAVEAIICHNQLLMPRDLHVLGRLLNVDAVVLGFMRSCDPCDGPSLHLDLELHDLRRHPSPFNPAPRKGRPGPLARLDRHFDARQASLQTLMDSLGFRSLPGGRAAFGRRSSTAWTDYLQFVSDRMVRDLLEQFR